MTGPCDICKVLSKDLREELQSYLEAAQSLEEASPGKEFDRAYQAAENAMLEVTTAHEQLGEHIAMHGGHSN